MRALMIMKEEIYTDAIGKVDYPVKILSYVVAFGLYSRRETSQDLANIDLGHILLMSLKLRQDDF